MIVFWREAEILNIPTYDIFAILKRFFPVSCTNAMRGPWCVARTRREYPFPSFLFATGNIDVILNLAESGKWFIGSYGERKSQWGRRKRNGVPDGREPRKFFQSPTNVTNSKTYGARKLSTVSVPSLSCLSFNNKTVQVQDVKHRD